jgi:hypothetical protein
MALKYNYYDIKRPGFTDGIKVRIYKTPESMKRGYLAEHYRLIKRQDTKVISDTVGLCFSTPRMISDLVDCDFSGSLYATIFLNEKYITTDIVIHEVGHATFTHEQDIERFGMDYSNREDLTHEERFCYHLGWLAAELLQRLKKDGYLR